MGQVHVYGASDDLIEIEGAVCDEIGAEGDGARFLHFNDGTVLKVQYAPPDYGGNWKIERVKAGTAEYKHEPTLGEDSKRYSDLVTLTGDLSSVEKWSRAEGPTDDDLEHYVGNWIDSTSIRSLDAKSLGLLYRAIREIEAA